MSKSLMLAELNRGPSVGLGGERKTVVRPQSSVNPRELETTG
jgi:hypothetical protein